MGYDPITKREIPRSYVYFLETRLEYFESLLKKNNITYEAAEVYDSASHHLGDAPRGQAKPPAQEAKRSLADRRNGNSKGQDEKEKIEKLVSNIGMVSVQGASDSRFLGSTSGISFARVVLSAVKSSVSSGTTDRHTKPQRANTAATGGSSMRDTYFGLQTKPVYKEAPFPDRLLADKLVSLYFEYANPQIPILHRGEFLEMVHHAYSVEPSKRTARELYLLNIVFGVGAGIIWGSSDPSPEALHPTESIPKRPRLASQQAQPEEYHASAIVHLGSLLSSSTGENGDRAGGDLEELQFVLLLAAFALMRPISPGLWYIVGVAMRLAVDLGLHYEDGTEIEQARQSSGATSQLDPREKGRREWTRDFRRRLWWCTYNFDRLVSTCVGRPFGITDQVVTTAFPSLLEDKHITRSDGLLLPEPNNEPSYKHVSHHYLRLRLLQSEILQVLQYQQAQQVRYKRRMELNEPIDTNILSPYLAQHTSFRSWRQNIDQRLYEWKESAPLQSSTGVSFDRKFLELNYWQAVIMLYRQSLTVPAPFINELSPTEEVSSPNTILEEKDDEDLVFLKCAEAGQNTLKLYRQLHRQRLVNYTYLATHHLFMAGISFLYAVWHSPAVRSRLTLDSFDFTVLAATSVLGDLMEKCPPAESCRDAFERMSKATVQMCLSTPGFGFSKSSPPPVPLKREPSFAGPLPMEGLTRTISGKEYTPIAPRPEPARRPPPQFDMNLQQLFPEDVEVGPRPSSVVPARNQRTRTFARPRPPTNFASAQRKTSEGASTSRTPINLTSTSPIFPNQLPLQTSPSPSMMSSYTQQPGSYDANTDIMDFTAAGTSIADNTDYNSYDFSALNEQESPLYPLDLGFGPGVMGFDSSHDWSDGQNFDLFDGFFFGNTGAVPGDMTDDLNGDPAG